MGNRVYRVYGQHVAVYDATWSECIPHNAHVVRVSHNMMYQSMLSTFTECLTI
jgi:hypothetical protein